MQVRPQRLPLLLPHLGHGSQAAQNTAQQVIRQTAAHADRELLLFPIVPQNHLQNRSCFFFISCRDVAHQKLFLLTGKPRHLRRLQSRPALFLTTGGFFMLFAQRFVGRQISKMDVFKIPPWF